MRLTKLFIFKKDRLILRNETDGFASHRCNNRIIILLIMYNTRERRRSMEGSADLFVTQMGFRA